MLFIYVLGEKCDMDILQNELTERSLICPESSSNHMNGLKGIFYFFKPRQLSW